MDGFKDSTRMKYMTGGPVKKAMGGTVPATAATTARPTTTAAPATSNLGPITRENLAARKAANTAAKAARGNITGTAAAASAPKLGPITRENFMERKRANTAAKAARGNTTGMAKGGSVKMREGISSRPTDDSGRRMTNEELGMTPGGVDPAKKKAMPKPAAKKPTPKVMSDLERARMMVRPLARKEGGGVPAHSDRPMIRRKTGGLTAMPKGKC
jgi:hypothetical protein